MRLKHFLRLASLDSVIIANLILRIYGVHFSKTSDSLTNRTETRHRGKAKGISEGRGIAACSGLKGREWWVMEKDTQLPPH